MPHHVFRIVADGNWCHIAVKGSGLDGNMRRQKAAPAILVVFLSLLGCAHQISCDTSPFEVHSGVIQVAFSATADMREYSGDNMIYFRRACARIAYGGPGDFMVSPGDIDPPVLMYADIQTYIDPNYSWYPAVGNHEAETDSDMIWLRAFNSNGNSLPNIVNSGPVNGVEPNYSFDHGDVHFTVLNEYYDGTSDTATDGDIPTALHDWLVADLTGISKPVKFVIGHEPAFPQPDEESGRLRH